MPSISTFISSRRQALVWLVASGTLLLSGCDPHSSDLYGGNSPFKGIDVTGADYASGFQLTDFNGQTRSFSDFKGKVVMLYFGFVQCPDVCPTALTRAAAVMQQLGPQAAELQVIFVTVDPERDTPSCCASTWLRFTRPSWRSPAVQRPPKKRPTSFGCTTKRCPLAAATPWTTRP